MPFAWPHASIRLRVLLAVAAVQALLLTVLLANGLRLVNEAGRTALDSLANQNAVLLLALVSSYGENARYAALEAALSRLLAETRGGLAYVRVMAPNGDLLVEAGAADAAPRPNGAAGGGIAAVRQMNRPFVMPDGQIGVLQFGVSVEPLALARSALLGQGSVIAAVQVLLTLGLLALVGHLLARTLERTLTAGRALAQGRLDYRLPVQGEDELARLSGQFNAMAASVKARVEDLQDAVERHRAGEQRHELALRGAGDGLWDWDIESETVYCSPRYIEMTGLSTDGAHHRAAAIFGRIHPQDAQAYHRQLIEHLKGASPRFHCEYRVRQADGSYRWVLKRGMTLRGGDGRAFRITGVLSDIHARKLAEMRDARSELAGQAQAWTDGAREEAGCGIGQAQAGVPTPALAFAEDTDARAG